MEKNVKKVIEPTWLRLKIYSNRKKQYLSIISKGKAVNVGNFLNIKELADLAKIIKQALIKREKLFNLRYLGNSSCCKNQLFVCKAILIS